MYDTIEILKIKRKQHKKIETLETILEEIGKICDEQKMEIEDVFHNLKFAYGLESFMDKDKVKKTEIFKKLANLIGENIK